MRVFGLLSSVAICCVAALSGCGSSDGPALLVPVSGTVLLENQPAAGVGVVFIPAENTKGVGASGATDAEGKFVLLHQSGNAGIEPGTYKVVFSRWRMPDGQPIPAGQSAADVGAVDMMPPHYSSPDRTIFTETISESGNEELTFQL